jgi:hypothetical protein
VQKLTNRSSRNAVQEIAFSNKAFESLVLPKNQKELILGFTSTQQGYRSQFDDVIEGKGRGIILLLWYASKAPCCEGTDTDKTAADLQASARRSQPSRWPKR